MIAIFSKSQEEENGEETSNTYYPIESAGIATGMLIYALHQAGLATLTHIPKPYAFLKRDFGSAAILSPLSTFNRWLPRGAYHGSQYFKKTIRGNIQVLLNSLWHALQVT